MKTFITFMLLGAIIIGTHAQATPIDFSPNRNIVSCGPTTVYFVYNRAITPDLISWDFGDGTFSGELAPAHRYTAPGSYTVKLIIIKNNQRDSVVKTNFVTIKAKPEARIRLTPPANYKPLKIQLSSESQHHADSFNRVRWITGGDTLEEHNTSYTYKAEGQYNIRLEVMNSCGCTDEKDTMIYISAEGFEPVTGIKEAGLSLMEVYPNPASSQSTIVLPEGLSAPFNLTMFDYNGRQVSPFFTRNGNNLVLQVESFPDGIYLLHLQSGNEQWKSRISIKH